MQVTSHRALPTYSAYSQHGNRLQSTSACQLGGVIATQKRASQSPHRKRIEAPQTLGETQATVSLLKGVLTKEVLSKDQRFRGPHTYPILRASGSERQNGWQERACKCMEKGTSELRTK